MIPEPGKVVPILRDRRGTLAIGEARPPYCEDRDDWDEVGVEGSETWAYFWTALRANNGIKTIAQTVATMLIPRTTNSPVLRPR